MRVMQISDIHFNYDNFRSSTLRNRLLSYVQIHNIKVDAIVITGDSVYKYGKTDGCEKFLQELRKRTGCKKSNVYICPGNHDVDRNNTKRNEKIEEIRKIKEEKKERVDITSQLADELMEIGYDKFSAFHQNVTGRKYKGFEVIVRNREEEKYRIININTCLLSKDDLDEGELRVCCNELEKLEKDIKNDEFINILIMHHGIEYFDEEDILPFQHWLEDNSIDIVLCGHSHRGNIRTLDETRLEIKQFVCGATMLDNYTIPSFLIYDFSYQDAKARVELYSFEKDEWTLGNSHLRIFSGGVYTYKLKRINQLKQKRAVQRYHGSISFKFNQSREKYLEQLIENQTNFLTSLDDKMYSNYGRKIYSSKYNCKEEFSSEKIVSSLLKIGIPYRMALQVTEAAVDYLISPEFKRKHFGDIKTEYIRNSVYFAICNLPCDDEKQFDKNEWAGKYARRYGHNDLQLVICDVNGVDINISHTFISDTIIKDMFYRVTGSNDCYMAFPRTEIDDIATSILDFLKECDVYALQYECLINILMEIASREPHPYIVTMESRERVLIYHNNKLEKHLKKLLDKEAEYITILETLYHSSALLISMYTNVIGYLETSPITILNQSISRMGSDNKAPISKITMIDIKKNMGNSDISWSEFVHLVYDICDSDIMKKVFVNRENEVVDKICKFAEISCKMYEDYLNRRITYEGKMKDMLSIILSNATGFVVKEPLENPRNCFWVSTNWEQNIALQYGLEKQILFIISYDWEKELNQIKSYLEKKTNNCGEVIWIKENGDNFDDRQIQKIKCSLKDININAFFLSEVTIAKWGKANADVRKEILKILTS